MKIGYFARSRQLSYQFVSFMREQGFDVGEIDYTRAAYLDGFDVVIIEQNGFSDYIENDEAYFQDYIRNGGICLFMHQDYQRWAPYFIPAELGHTQLIYRHVETVYDYKCYMLPTIEKAGKRLFSEPNLITPGEMVYWKIKAVPSALAEENQTPKTIQSAALSCFLAPESWEILGSYMDPAVKDGALILQAKYGDGLYFINQILFPEALDENTPRILAFWKKYIQNLFAHFKRFKEKDFGDAETVQQSLPLKRNYKMAIHMHSLDWYGCDSSLGTINAVMRHKNMDICAVAVKDAAPYDGTLDLSRYSDEKVLFLHGQEYHPFNWNDSNEKYGHNTYHLLAIGINGNAYTTEFTRSLFSDSEIDGYLHRAIEYIHAQGGAVCATHPWCPYWQNYACDAVDMEPLRTASGTDIEKYWLSGRKIAIMNSVDLFGVRRMLDNPAVNFIYPLGAPDRDSIVSAVKSGHCIAAAHIAEADISLNDCLPGDTLPLDKVQSALLKIKAAGDNCRLKEVRIYSAADLILSRQFDSVEIEMTASLAEFALETFVRVEISGEKPEQIAVSTPFYLE